MRLGAFDVLVGINLLREGLDIPECGLVAILDADKEGFLRSETSLIQTIGRAARNIEGRVILYADKETKSIKNALLETDRRREKQLTHNKENNITPETIKKNVNDVLEGVFGADTDFSRVTAALNNAPKPGENLEKHLKNLRKQMFELAENLDFEEAANIRDEIKRLEDVDLEIGINPFIRQHHLENITEPSSSKKGLSKISRSKAGAAGTRVVRGKVVRK